MTTKEIYVQADTNDADYISRIEDITDKQLEDLMPLFTAIKEFKIARRKWHCHSWPRSEYTKSCASPEKNLSRYISRYHRFIRRVFLPIRGRRYSLNRRNSSIY